MVTVAATLTDGLDFSFPKLVDENVDSRDPNMFCTTADLVPEELLVDVDERELCLSCLSLVVD